MIGLDIYVAAVEFESHDSQRWSPEVLAVRGTCLGDRLQASGPPVPLRALIDE